MRNQGQDCAIVVANFALFVFLIRYAAGTLRATHAMEGEPMIRPARSVIVMLTSVLVVLWPAGAAAQPAPPADLTLDQVRSRFVGGGYEVGETLHFDWTSPPVTSFLVRDRRGSVDRVLMVLLYPDSPAAQSAHRLAQVRQETAQNRSLVYTDTHGSPVVLGYGESVWRQNVAMVQSSQSDLNRIFRAALDLDHQMGAHTGDDKPGTDAEDADRLEPKGEWPGVGASALPCRR